MDDSRPVRDRKAPAGLEHDVRSAHYRQWPEPLQEVSAVFALEKLHDQVRGAVCRAPHVGDGHKVRMLQTTGRFRFALESRQHLTVARELREQELHCESATQLRVARLEDCAHTALAQQSDDDVLADDRANARVRRLDLGLVVLGSRSGILPSAHAYGSVGSSEKSGCAESTR